MDAILAEAASIDRNHQQCDTKCRDRSIPL